MVDGKSFLYGDISGGTSGSLTNAFRDAVIYCAENTYINGGGLFSIPGQFGAIRAFVETNQLNAAFGQGPLQVHTPTYIFTCAVPIDRLTWQTTTNVILGVTLIGRAGAGHNSTITVNSDTVFRQIDGIGSLIIALRDFDTWGNVPISQEVIRILKSDAQNLLPFGTAVNFDNRLLMSAAPTSSTQGVYHQGMVSLNFDPISGVRGKSPSVYDGSWPGLNALQMVVGEFALVNRCFAYVLNSGAIGLTEILPDKATPDEWGKGGTSIMDNGTTPITWWFESPCIFHEADESQRVYKRLINGDISVDTLIGQVNFSVFYRPDDYPIWIPWDSWSECSSSESAPQFRPRMGLGEPDATVCEETTNRPYREGYYFQIKIVVQGWCRFKGARFLASAAPEPKFAPPKCSTICANPVQAIP